MTAYHTYEPDNLVISGERPLDTCTVTVANGLSFKRGEMVNVTNGACAKITSSLPATHVMAEDVTAEGGACKGLAYVSGTFNAAKLSAPSSYSVTQKDYESLRDYGIIVKDTL